MTAHNDIQLRYDAKLPEPHVVVIVEDGTRSARHFSQEWLARRWIGMELRRMELAGKFTKAHGIERRAK